MKKDISDAQLITPATSTVPAPTTIPISGIPSFTSAGCCWSEVNLSYAYDCVFMSLYGIYVTATVAQKTAPMFTYYVKTHVLLNADII